MTLQKSGLTLRPVEDGDLVQLGKWLNREHVLRWYHDADEWMNEISKRNGEFAFLNHYIVEINGVPTGFGQYYDCFDAKEDWYAAKEPGRMFSIDYFIGEEDYLRRGYGKETVKALIGLIQRRQADAEIVVQPEPENIASGKALLVNGFSYDEKYKYYSLLLKSPAE